ncbi:MAG: DUF2207 domain-containing protein [Coprothermobacterota bacterium]|nr:DUF2207 domain-containing protein [Coprothermobacterota bacterium]
MRRITRDRWRRLATLSLLLAVMFSCLQLILPTGVQAKDYVWTVVSLEVQVQADGNLLVEETRSLRFEDNYHFAYIYIDKVQIEGVDQVSVRKAGGSVYRRDASNAPGTYSVTDEGSRVTIRWNFDYTNSTHSWVIGYRLVGAALRGAISFWQDYDQLYFKFIGAEHEKAMEQARVTIHLPAGATKEQLLVWAYGPAPGSGEVTIVDGATVRLESPLDVGVGLEARLLFPQGLVPLPSGMSRYSQSILPQVQQEQQAQDNAAWWRRFWLDAQYILAIAIASLVPIWMIFQWWTKGRELRIPPSTAMISGPPTGLLPAGVDALWRQTSTQKGIQATIFDLAHKGYLKMEQEGADFRLTKLKEDQDLQSYESFLFNLLFGAQGQITTLSAMAHALSAYVSSFQKEIWAYLAPYRFFDADPGKVRATYSAVGMLMLFGGIALFVLQVFILGIGLVFASFFVLGFGSAMPRRSYTGARELSAWKAFMQYMLELEKRPALRDSSTIFSEYLPYAIVFGIEKGWVASFAARPDFYAPSWWVWAYAGAYGSSAMGGSSQFGQALQNSFNDFGARVSTAFTPERSSSSGGGGGGFSGGGGGGGGGGGSGAG